jgi:cell wall-associated NlpC family hydrolase
MLRAILILIFISMLSACGPKKYTAPSAKISKNDSVIVKKLYGHYNEWRGVKYHEGGMSKKGVDCSAYVHLAYRQKLNKKIPRSTELLSKAGRAVKKENLRPGDVVFFKTGWKARHVGIYVNKGEFMHASSSRGVMISKLNNPYWIDAFWMARRY